MPQLLKKFENNQPTASKFSISTGTGLSPDILNSLLAEEFDVAFCSKCRDDNLFEFTPISRQKMVLITPLNHPLANKAAVNLAETLPYPQITFALKSGLSHQLADLFNLCGGKPNSICAVEEDETIAGLVANDFGIAVVPMMDMLYNLPIRIIPISFPKWERAYLYGDCQRPSC